MDTDISEVIFLELTRLLCYKKNIILLKVAIHQII